MSSTLSLSQKLGSDSVSNLTPLRWCRDFIPNQRDENAHHRGPQMSPFIFSSRCSRDLDLPRHLLPSSINYPRHYGADYCRTRRDGRPSPLAGSLSLMASNSSAHLWLRSVRWGDKVYHYCYSGPPEHIWLRAGKLSVLQWRGGQRSR